MSFAQASRISGFGFWRSAPRRPEKVSRCVAVCVCGPVQTARSQRVARSGRRRSGVTLSKAVCCPILEYGAAIHPGQLVLLSAKDSVKAYMRGADLGCDPASWFSVADASMGMVGRPDLHNVPTHPRVCPRRARMHVNFITLITHDASSRLGGSEPQ